MEEDAVSRAQPLLVRVAELSPYLVAQWVGSGVDEARATAEGAGRAILRGQGERVVLDVHSLDRVSDAVVAVLQAIVLGAARQGRELCWVGCSESLARALMPVGSPGAILHAPSLGAATAGRWPGCATTMAVHLRSTPDLLARLRHVVAALAEDSGLSTARAEEVRIAVTEAASNAMRHGSPQAARNHVRVAVHRDASRLVVEVSDQGPGFDPPAHPQPRPDGEGGYGLLMMKATMDQVQFFRSDSGMMVRMTKRL